MLEVTCPGCGRQLKIDERLAGCTGRCNHCQSVIQVPSVFIAQESTSWTGEPARPYTPDLMDLTYESPKKTTPHCPIFGYIMNPSRTKILYGIVVSDRARDRFALRRQFAFALDIVLANTILAAIGIMAAICGWVDTSNPSNHTIILIYTLINLLVMFLIFPLKDGFSGYSPGKWLMGVRVYDVRTSKPIRFAQSFLRNLPIQGALVMASIPILFLPADNSDIIDMWHSIRVLPAYLPLLIYIVFGLQLLKGNRFGDAWAHTKVIWEKYSDRLPFKMPGTLQSENSRYDAVGQIPGKSERSQFAQRENIKLKHSGLGIASFITSVMVASFIFLIVIAGAMESSTPSGMDEKSVGAIAGAMKSSTPDGMDEKSAGTIGLDVFISVFVFFLFPSLVALGLGIGGLLQKDRKKIFAILGTVISAVLILIEIVFFIALKTTSEEHIVSTGLTVAQRNEPSYTSEMRNAADQGDAIAQQRLGICYFNAKGIPKDDVEAVKWFRKAADKGYAGAQRCLGACYALGRGVPKDEVEAAKWYSKAAAQGDTDAQEILGLSNAKGRGIQDAGAPAKSQESYPAPTYKNDAAFRDAAEELDKQVIKNMGISDDDSEKLKKLGRMMEDPAAYQAAGERATRNIVNRYSEEELRKMTPAAKEKLMLDEVTR